jgi:hypothetical protein
MKEWEGTDAKSAIFDVSELSDKHSKSETNPLRQWQNFCYLGRILTSIDSNWTATRENLRKAQRWWTLISCILTRESASPRISATFYKATIQTLLLYGSETWVLTDDIIQLLRSFHHGIAQKLTGRHPRPIPDTDDWIYLSIQETLHIAGLFPMKEYLKRWRGYLEQHTTVTNLTRMSDRTSNREPNPTYLLVEPSTRRSNTTVPDQLRRNYMTSQNGWAKCPPPDVMCFFFLFQQGFFFSAEYHISFSPLSNNTTNQPKLS